MTWLSCAEEGKEDTVRQRGNNILCLWNACGTTVWKWNFASKHSDDSDNVGMSCSKHNLFETSVSLYWFHSNPNLKPWKCQDHAGNCIGDLRDLELTSTDTRGSLILHHRVLSNTKLSRTSKFTLTEKWGRGQRNYLPVVVKDVQPNNLLPQGTSAARHWIKSAAIRNVDYHIII